MTDDQGTRVLIVAPDITRMARIAKAARAADRRIETTCAFSLEEAHAAVVEGGEDCVLVDLPPDRHEAMKLLTAVLALAPSLPILALVDAEDEATTVRVLRLGAQDCVSTGGLSGPRLRRAIRHAVERHAVQRALLMRAFTDVLTGLPNRQLFMDRLGHALARAQRQDGTLAVIFVDLDGFKPVNDTYGHAIGDRVLAGFARHLLRALRPSDTVARYGGDEFTVLCEDAGSVEDVVAVARRVAAVAKTLLVVGRHRFTLSVSVGLAFSSERTADAEELVAQADVAMYEAKNRRTAGLVIASDEHRAIVARAAQKDPEEAPSEVPATVRNLPGTQSTLSR